jgi:hypothetical protein
VVASPLSHGCVVYLSNLLRSRQTSEPATGDDGLELGGSKWAAGQGLQPSPARKCFQMLPTSARHTRARSTHMNAQRRLFCVHRHAPDIKAQRRARKQIVGNLERSGRRRERVLTRHAHVNLYHPKSDI